MNLSKMNYSAAGAGSLTPLFAESLIRLYFFVYFQFCVLRICVYCVIIELLIHYRCCGGLTYAHYERKIRRSYLSCDP